MIKGHYTKAEHLGDIDVPGAHGISFRDADTLYVSRAIGHSAPSTGGIVACSMDLTQEDFISNNCSYYGVAAGPGGAVAVRNGTANELEIYSQERTKAFNMELPAGKHKGIAVDEKGDIYICDAASDCIRVYEASGVLSKVIKHKELKQPHYVAATRSGLVVTCMGDEPGLLSLDVHGELNWSYEDLEFPAGVAVDANNDVYVCDVEEKKVVMVTNEGDLSFDMITDQMLGYKKPFAVAVHGNKLAVQLFENDTIKLFKLAT